MNPTNLMIAGGIATSAASSLIPVSSMYKSGQENRGVLNTGAHLIGATAIGGGLAVGSNIGIGALAAKMTKAV